MKTKLNILILAAFAMIMFTSCAKEEGVGGKRTIKGTVTYTAGSAAGAIVYISYGASEATAEYDNTTVTDASGAFMFEGLEKGDYYVDAKYTDGQGFEFNTAGATVKLEKKKGDVTVDLALE